jgi:hypothetical protein
VYSGTDWVPLASEVTNLSGYQTKASNQFPNRNLLINGDMQVAQRATSVASITSGNYYTLDRWRFTLNAGTHTMSQEADAPTGSGFRQSLKVLATTGKASLSAGDEAFIEQKLEGQNLQHIKKGTAAAEQLTVSFWVKSSVTGTYIVLLNDVDNSRSVSKSYTVNASATWEYKTVTFPADTTGAFDNDNAGSLFVRFAFAMGTNFTSGTLNTVWGTDTAANRYVGQVNAIAANNNYFQITGTQLEVGPTATPFEFKPFAQDLEECQRYYQKSFPANITPADAIGYGVGSSNSATQNFFSVAQVCFPVEMRSAPTITYFNPNAVVANKIRDASGNNYPAYTQVGPTTKGFTVAVNNTSFAGGGTLGFVNYTAEIEL